MENKRTELLGYIRVLYERKSEKASKEGFTSWAIVAGMMYVLWDFFDVISQFNNVGDDRIHFYYKFSQVYMVLFMGAAFALFDGDGGRRNSFDYRIINNDHISTKSLFVLIIVIGFPMYCIDKAVSIEALGMIGKIQLEINFWFLSIMLAAVCFAFAQESLRGVLGKFPQPVLSKPKGKVQTFILSVLYVISIEIFVVNAVLVFDEVYGGSDKGRMLVAALDLSLLLMGYFLFFRQKNAALSLSNLSRLERDAVIHELSEGEIRRRLQEEYLGIYVGDWVDGVLVDIREKESELTSLLDEAEKLQKEISEIDSEYRFEREGRVADYLGKIKLLFGSYNKIMVKFSGWLREAGNRARYVNDAFMESIVLSTIDELEANAGELNERVFKTFEIFGIREQRGP